MHCFWLRAIACRGLIAACIVFTSTVRCSIGAHSAWLSAFVITYDFCICLPTFFLQVATFLAFISIAAMTAPASPVTPKEHIRDPQPLKDSLAFVYDTDVHQLSSFIRSGPPLGRTKLMLALGLSFQAPGSRISGPPAPEGSIPPKEKEKGEKVEKKVEEDPPSIHKDVDRSDKSISSKDTPKDATPPGAGPSIPGDAASASAADPSIATPPPTTLPSVRKPKMDPVADPAFLEQKPEGTACRVSTRQITCCREPCGYCNGLCGYSSEIPFDSHFESKHTIHLCKGCFRAKREAKSVPSYEEDRDEEWDDNSWNQSWGGGWSWHYHQ